MYLIIGNYYKNAKLRIVSIHLNETYKLLVPIAIDNETEIEQLKKIKDMLLNKNYKGLMSNTLDKVKIGFFGTILDKLGS